METESIPKCTDFVHIGRSYYVFSRVLPLIQSWTPTNSPFELRAQLASMCTASCVCIFHLLSSSCCTTHKSTVATSVLFGMRLSLLCALHSIDYYTPVFPLCARHSIAYRTPASPLDYHFEKCLQSVHSPENHQSSPCMPSATHLQESAPDVSYCTATSVSRMLCSSHGRVSV